MGLLRVRWAMLLTALAMGVLACAAAVAQGGTAGVLGAGAVVGWMGLLVLGYCRVRAQGLVFDAVEVLLLVAVMASLGMQQSLGVFYAALFFRTVHASRTRIVVGVVGYFLAQVLGAGLVDGLSAAEVAQLPAQAWGFVFTAFSLSVVTGTLLARGQELARERRLLEAVLDSLDVAVVACDSEGGLVKANTAARTAGLSAALLWHGADGDRQVRDGATAPPRESLPLRRALAAVTVRDQQVGVVDASGEQRDYSVNARTVLAEDDAPLLVVAALHDVSERRRAEQRLERQALHDALTGLPNRLLLRDRITQALLAADRRSSAPALLFLDLDGFKSVNDSAGHDAGDHVLLTIADRLAGCLRPQDTLARLGGDEFAVLLEETTAEEAVAVAHRLVAVSSQPVSAVGLQFTVGASVGVAAPGLDEVRAGLLDSGDLLRNADLAMYEAKSAGKRRVEVYASQMHEALVARVTLERDLRAALHNGELRLHYQPVVCLSTGRTVGAEALLRWQSPQRGLVPPGDFIALAEDSGMILPIGAWVLHQACQQAAAWQASGRPELSGLHIAVNVSVHQLHAPGLLQTVQDALSDSGLPAARLVLEITESAFGDIETTLPRLHELRALGVQLAIDDFGTGYSSLTRLQMFPVDTVKIDRSFVTTIQADHAAPLITATLALARAFGLSTVAEGVEDEVQAQFLRAQGCPVAQGFRYSRPVPAADFATWVTPQPALAGRQPLPADV